MSRSKSRFIADLIGSSGNVRADKMGSSALSDLSNVTSLPASVVTQLKGDTGDTGAAGSTSATDLISGTLADARFPATLPAVSGANLTSVSAATLNGYTISVVTTVPTTPVANTIYLVEV
tara:strand:- start:2527 stop:2886 length:360 start_codon:yes stop_codon:yes gene_type:complete